MRGLPALREEVAALRREVQALRTALAEPWASLPEALRRRGILLGRADPADRLLFPPTLSAARLTRLYEQLKRYSFRLFLRDLIAHQETLRPETLTRFCSPEAAARYVRFLTGCGIIRRGRGGVLRLHPGEVFSFGPTLEWLVAQILTREFGAPALWGCRLLDETFVVDGSVFLTNTRPSLVQALGTCLRAHFGRR